MQQAQLRSMTNEELDQLAINTIRTLSIDAVQQANSGHPGTPMALAPLVYTIWNAVLRFDPQDPIWPNRDRFVLSNGHASMLLWSVLLSDRHPGRECGVRAPRQAVGHARRHPPFPPARQQSAGASGISLGLRGRNDDRSARSGRGHQRRHGHRAKVAGQPLQQARLRHLRLQHLCGLRRRLPDGRRQLGGRLARRPSSTRRSVLDLRQQPHHHRGQHQHHLHRGRSRALSCLSVECAAGWRCQRSPAHRGCARGLPEDRGAGRR